MQRNDAPDATYANAWTNGVPTVLEVPVSRQIPPLV